VGNQKSNAKGFVCRGELLENSRNHFYAARKALGADFLNFLKYFRLFPAPTTPDRIFTGFPDF
jgi:hypothetical protein